MKKLGLILAFSMIAFIALSEVPFNGLVLDQEMQPKKGVKVYVKNPKHYARTDKKGRFGLTDVQPDDTLTLVLSKNETIRVPVDGKKGIKIVVAGDKNVRAENDDDIANLGYGFVKRRENIGVSSGISGDRLRASGHRDILGALKGKVPGVIITGSLGEYKVVIRGNKTLKLSDEPLYMVDGVAVNSLDEVSIEEVDHVEVLKEATQYGSRGACGAILVTTKSGKSRQARK